MTNTRLVDFRNKITVQEAAKHAGRHQETVKRWLREGRLPGQKVGLVWYIDQDDLKSLLDDEAKGTQHQCGLD